MFVELHWISRTKTTPCVCACSSAHTAVCVILLTLSECISKSVAVNDMGGSPVAYPQYGDLCFFFFPLLGVSSYGHVVRNIYIL